MRSLLRPFWLALAGAGGPAGVIVLPAAVLALLGLLLLLASSVRAHSWYEGIQLWQPGMASPLDCCGESDCSPYPHRSTAGGLGYEALIGGKWIPLPRENVVGEYSPDGHVHVCCIGGHCARQARPQIRCVILPGAAS